MARVSQPIELTPQERSNLESMLSYVDDRLAERIRIVLACAEEASNKKVAINLHIDEHRVAKWKEAFRTKGIEGLGNAKGAGRKPKAIVTDLEEEVIRLLNDESKEWTVHALAVEIGATDYQVSKILHSKSISLCRKRQWSYQTLDSLSSADIEITGLYVSADACAVLMSHHPFGIRTAPGVFTTGNKDMAEKLQDAGYQLSVLGVLAETRYWQQSSASGHELPSVIRDWAESVRDGDHTRSFPKELLKYYLFVWSREGLVLKEALPDQISFCSYGTAEEFLADFHGKAGGLTSAAHLYEIELLSQSIEAYLKLGTPDLEPFSWKKEITAVGSKADPVPYHPWKEKRSETDMKEWVQQLILGEVPESEIQTGMIAFTKSSDGFSYRVIKGNEEIPGPDQFSFDSEEGFLRGMNKLEKGILKMRDETGIATTELFLEEVKKKRN